MADKKISQLTSLAQNDIDTTADVLAIVDTGATETKKSTPAAIVNAVAVAGIATLNATTVDATNVEVTNVKAKDGTAAFTIADSTGKVTVSTELAVDNINVSGNAITSTDTNGNIDLTPNGTGEVNITKVDIDSGAIDGTAIGANSASTGAFSTLSASGNVTLSGGTANGVLYLNASKVATSGSALQFSGTNLSLGAAVTSLTWGQFVGVQANYPGLVLSSTASGGKKWSIGADAAVLTFRNETDSTTAAVIDGSNNLGIGTSSPTSKLTVAGGAVNLTSNSSNHNIYQGTGWIWTSDGTGSGTTRGGIYASSNGALSLFGGSTISSQVTLDSSGNLGIGTSSPAQKLHVAGNSQVKPTTGTDAVWTRTSNDSGEFYLGTDNSAGSGFTGTAYARFLYSTGAYPIAFYTNSTEKMRLDSSGNLGIGTSSPSTTLDVASSNSGITLTNTAVSNKKWRLGGNSSGYFVITESGVADRMFIDTSGNLGIGTSSPAVKLDVAGASTTQMRVQMSGQADVRLLSDTGTGVTGTYSNHPFTIKTNSTDVMSLTAAGNVGIGTSSPNYLMTMYKASLPVLQLANSTSGSTSSDGLLMYLNGANATISNEESGYLRFQTGGTERAVIDSSGNLGLGVTPSAWTAYKALELGELGGCVAAGGNNTILTYNTYYSSAFKYAISGRAASYYQQDAGKHIWYGTSTTGTAGNAITFGDAKMTLDASGNLLVAATSANVGNTGHGFLSGSLAYHTVSSAACLYINRTTNDGDLVVFRQDNVDEGSISVSGNTVSYNAFAGSHWSQLQDGSKPDILRGTVMESINELCVWPGEQNERLPKSKISDTAGSKKVYGVFMAWDNDWTTTNDMYVTAVGAFICRVNGSVTVQEGDLLESNGDGTARVQADDIIRSSTIGKVTSTVKTHEYDDGSYCVPTVLYCG